MAISKFHNICSIHIEYPSSKTLDIESSLEIPDQTIPPIHRTWSLQKVSYTTSELEITAHKQTQDAHSSGTNEMNQNLARGCLKKQRIR